MVQAILELFRGLPPELTTLILASLPVAEVRLAVPVALEVFQMPVWKAATLSFIGSVIPAVVLPVVLAPLEGPCRKYSKVCDNVFNWVTRRVEKRYTERYRAYGALGLVLFIAIPLPVTGVWTGSLASWLFHIPKRWAIPSIIIGTGISTLIVTLSWMGVFGAIKFVL